MSATLLWLLVAQAEPPVPTIVVFPPVERGKLDKGAGQRVQAAVDEVLAELGVKVLAGARLAKALKRKPAAALRPCGANIECIAKLGARARADEVLLVQVAKNDGGLELTFLAVTVSPPGMRSHTSVTLAAREGKEALAPTLLNLYPRIAEAAVVAEAPATHGGEGAATSAIDPLRLLEEQGSGAPWLRYTGMGAAAAGALVTGAGVYFGLQSGRTRGSLDRQSGMSQKEAIATNDRANDQASRANLTLLVGSVLLTAGVTALGLDRWGHE